MNDENNEHFNECPYCGHNVLVRDMDALICDECNMIVATILDSEWNVAPF